MLVWKIDKHMQKKKKDFYEKNYGTTLFSILQKSDNNKIIKPAILKNQKSNVSFTIQRAFKTNENRTIDANNTKYHCNLKKKM